MRKGDRGFAAPISSICCGGANGHLSERSMGYSGTSAMTASAESVPDTSTPSFLDVDGKGRARRGRRSGVVGQLWSGPLDQQRDDAVVVAWVEHVGRVEHALPRRDALVLVHRHLHRRSSFAVTGASHMPTIASISPEPAACHDVRATVAPLASARSRSAQLCINRFRAMM